MSLLSDKVVLITGAARGIGCGVARILAENGATVGVADIQPEVEQIAEDLKKEGYAAHHAIFDISSPDQVEEGVREIVSSLGEIDVLVNNAGIVTNIAPLRKMSIEAWRQEIDVNLNGAFYLIKAVIEPMIK